MSEVVTLKDKLRRREAQTARWRIDAFNAYRLGAPNSVVMRFATRYARWAELADLTCQRLLAERES